MASNNDNKAVAQAHKEFALAQKELEELYKLVLSVADDLQRRKKTDSVPSLQIAGKNLENVHTHVSSVIMGNDPDDFNLLIDEGEEEGQNNQQTQQREHATEDMIKNLEELEKILKKERKAFEKEKNTLKHVASLMEHEGRVEPLMQQLLRYYEVLLERWQIYASSKALIENVESNFSEWVSRYMQDYIKAVVSFKEAISQGHFKGIKQGVKFLQKLTKNEIHYVDESLDKISTLVREEHFLNLNTRLPELQASLSEYKDHMSAITSLVQEIRKITDGQGNALNDFQHDIDKLLKAMSRLLQKAETHHTDIDRQAQHIVENPDIYREEMEHITEQMEALQKDEGHLTNLIGNEYQKIQQFFRYVESLYEYIGNVLESIGHTENWMEQYKEQIEHPQQPQPPQQAPQTNQPRQFRQPHRP